MVWIIRPSTVGPMALLSFKHLPHSNHLRILPTSAHPSALPGWYLLRSPFWRWVQLNKKRWANVLLLWHGHSWIGQDGQVLGSQKLLWTCSPAVRTPWPICELTELPNGPCTLSFRASHRKSPSTMEVFSEEKHGKHMGKNVKNNSRKWRF